MERYLEFRIDEQTTELKKAKKDFNATIKTLNHFCKEAGKDNDLRKSKDWKTNVYQCSLSRLSSLL